MRVMLSIYVLYIKERETTRTPNLPLFENKLCDKNAESPRLKPNSIDGSAQIVYNSFI